MSDTILLREYQKEDHDKLAEIIRKTWNYDEFCDPKTAAALAGVYLDSCLANQTYTQVAVINGTPAGIIMGKLLHAHKTPLRFKLRMLCSCTRLLLTRNGRAASRIFSNVDQIDQELLADCNRQYQGEVAFFAVSPECRGKGIGKMLFQSLLAYMRQEQVTDFFLFTDTSCNFGFYESQGLKRRSQKAHTFQLGSRQADMTFFVYDCVLS